MTSGSGALSVANPAPGWDPRSWIPTWSRPAAVRALRTTLVMPALFALTLKGFGNPQMALFAGFGSFATLVLVSFEGPPAARLRAHLGLAVAGSLLLIIGTAISRSTAATVIVTVPVTFLVFFSGIIAPNAASGVTGALLAFVLPAATPASLNVVGDRLAGWWLASVAGTAAVLLITTPAGRDRVRLAAARTARTLGEELDAALRGERRAGATSRCIAAKHALIATFTESPLPPSGVARRDQAVANAVELLEWCTSLLADALRAPEDLRDGAEVERALLAAVAELLRDSGRLLAGEPVRPDLRAVERCRTASLGWLHALTPGSPDFERQARISFHAHTIAMTALAIGADALLAAGLVAPDEVAEARALWFERSSGDRRAVRAALGRYTDVVVRHASVRSVWFVNSIRGAFALAAALAVADLLSLQHGFWVVLGTLSVLRTNASATGATAMRALLGTLAGFVVGALLLAAIGTAPSALWIALPVSVLIAAYSPGTAPFAVGQAAFTVTVVVLFNLLDPVGWRVGELRVLDVAIGCSVSLLVGVILWPRGVAPLVGDDLGDAFRAGADYLAEAIDWVCGIGKERPVSGRPALTAGLRLDYALRGYLAEQGAKRISREELWRLVGGTQRLRLTAHAIAAMPRECVLAGSARAAGLDGRTASLVSWYWHLAEHLGRPRGARPRLPAVPELSPPRTADRTRLTLWLHEHLDHLTEQLPNLVGPAQHLAEIRRRPWWR